MSLASSFPGAAGARPSPTPRRWLVTLATAMALLVALPGVPAAQDLTEATSRAAGYVVETQTATGAFGNHSQSPDYTGVYLLSVVAGGAEGDPVEDALHYIRRHGPSRAAEQPAYAGRIALGVAAAGEDPRDFDGTDYVALAEARYNPLTGRYDTNFYANLLAALGVLTIEELPPRAIDYIRLNQCPDGGFSWREACTGRPDTDTTSLAINVLTAAGGADSAVERARTWLVEGQNPDGGFAHWHGDPTDANATGLALTAIAAMGEDPTAGTWEQADGDPVQALLSLQHDSGGFRWRAEGDDPNTWATVQALPGLSGRSLPLTLEEGDDGDTPPHGGPPQERPGPPPDRGRQNDRARR